MIGILKGSWVQTVVGLMSGLPLMDMVYQEVQFKDKKVMMDVETMNELGKLWVKLRREMS